MLGSASIVSIAAVKYGARRLAQDGCLGLGGILEPRDEHTSVEPRAVRGLPPLVLVQAVEIGAGLQLVERPVQVEVREDPPNLFALVGAADENGVDVHPDELQPLEIVEDARHRECKDSLVLQFP